MRPPRDVALILIWHAEREPVQFDPTGLREMKNVFVAIIEESRRIYRLEVAKRFGAAFDPHPALRVRLSLARERIKVRVAIDGLFIVYVDCDGFDPVNRVLQNEKLAQRDHDFVRQHRIGRRGADVEKK
jgi:hypothetical protein